MTMLAQTPFTSAQGAIDAAHSVEEAIVNLTRFWIVQGVCFTSGHVTHAIRSARQDLVFGQARIGAFIRDQFETGNLPDYDDGCGGQTTVVRQPRNTTGIGRTPVGTEVLVYGPTVDECSSFEFEINIAEAPQVSDGQGGQMSAAAALLGATPGLAQGSPGASPIPPVQPSGTVAVAHGKMVPGNPFAVIHADGRLCIPRIAFEALAFESGTPVKGGEALYATVTGTKLCVALAGPGIEVKPTTDRLRVHVMLEGALAVPGTPFACGKDFEIKVAATGLTIDLV